MDVKRYTPCNIGRTINRPIMLGKVGEINALRIEFDCEEWLTDYPDAAVELFVKRPDNDKYHPALGEDGYVRIWIIDERAVLAAGSGVIELVLKDARSGTSIKSATGYTTVVSSPSAEGEASDLGFVAYSRAQNLTEAQKRQARNNIGAGTGTGTGTGSGTDGFSPTIKVEKIDGGNRLTITDIDGTKVVDVMDGKNGKNGEPGEDGRGIESVVRTSGDGSPGSTDVYTITYTDGYTSTLTVYNGKDGAAGENGVSPTVAVETIDGGHRVTITSADSPKSFEVMDGKTGDPGAPGAPGEKGEAGRGILNIARTSGDGSAGTVDTYTIYYTDGTESTYQVRNGADGKDGSNAEGGGSSVELDNTLTQSGKAADAKATGDALNELKEANDAQDTRIKALEDSGGATDEQIGAAVDAYLTANPVEAYVDYDVNVKAVAHRGYSATAPENTIPAYIEAKKQGFKYVECDVQFTSDGVGVLCHNGTIDSTSDGSGTVTMMTYAELYQYDFGSWKNTKYAGTKIATLDEFLRTCRGLGLHPYIEIKSGCTSAQRVQIVEAVKRAGMSGKVTYISFIQAALTDIKNADSEARLGLCADNVTSSTISTVSGLKTDDNDVFISADYGKVTDDVVALCINAGIPLEVWTVNTASVIENLNPYITGVTSDSLIAGKILYEKHMGYIVPEEPEIEVIPATKITLSANELTFDSASSQMLTATVEPSDTTDTVVWTTDAGDIATVSGGLVTAVSNGTAVITATAGSVSASCTVTVNIAESGGGEDDKTYLYNWDFTKSLTDTVSGLTATLNGGATQDADGVHLNSANSYIILESTVGMFAPGRTVEFDIGASDANLGTSHGRLFCYPGSQADAENGNGTYGLVYRNTGKWNTYVNGWASDTTVTDPDALANTTVSLKKVDEGGARSYVEAYINGALLVTSGYNDALTKYPYVFIGASSQAFHAITIKACRVYDS